MRKNAKKSLTYLIITASMDDNFFEWRMFREFNYCTPVDLFQIQLSKVDKLKDEFAFGEWKLGTGRIIYIGVEC